MGSKVQRNYKDRLFCMVFREREALLSLYNAVNSSHYTDPEALEMLIDRKTLYGSTLVKIPTPKFVVFYNGTEEQPERLEMKLSDAFRVRTGEIQLELKVLQLNINQNCNRELMEQCGTLKEYAVYVQKVRDYAGEMNIQEAVERAVTECIREGILERFLRKYRREAVAVSIFEYDEEKEMKLLREAEREVGYEHGIEQGMEKASIENARNFFRKGASLELVLECITGIPREKLEEIYVEETKNQRAPKEP